ncbi:hypothetical protein JGU66_31210 [Myxococcaceae bacterium JPH2]|nr:hypothetical protein [Myxococcaceae bacterium JPH2]
MTMVDPDLPDEGDDDFRRAFGADLASLLDLESWTQDMDLGPVIQTFRKEVTQAVNKEDYLRELVRRELLPRMQGRTGGPPEAGLYQCTEEELIDIQQGLLFRGNVDAVCGSAVSHDNLSLGITQLGLVIANYGGTSGSLSQRLFRREVADTHANAFQEACDFIERRQKSPYGERDSLSKLARRCIRPYAERALLVHRAEAEWRMGVGNPCTRELVTGAGYHSLLHASLSVLRRLVTKHPKFVFVSDDLEERGLLTLGHALDSREYLVLETMERECHQYVNEWEYRNHDSPRARRFVQECCPLILRGVYRVSTRSPPRLFYAHRDHVHLAVRVAMADSAMYPERGLPMLLGVAAATCRSVFGEDGFLGLVQDAYAQAGASLRYLHAPARRR